MYPTKINIAVVSLSSKTKVVSANALRKGLGAYVHQCAKPMMFVADFPSVYVVLPRQERQL